MSLSTIATSKFFPLHKPVVVTADGVDPVDGLLTGPIALAADGLSRGVHIVFVDDVLEKGVKHVVNAAVALRRRPPGIPYRTRIPMVGSVETGSF
jgi:hypothetical protein